MDMFFLFRNRSILIVIKEVTSCRALLTTKVEYMIVTSIAFLVVWLSRILSELKYKH